jgi:hypothetical protein
VSNRFDSLSPTPALSVRVSVAEAAMRVRGRDPSGTVECGPRVFFEVQRGEFTHFGLISGVEPLTKPVLVKVFTR